MFMGEITTGSESIKSTSITITLNFAVLEDKCGEYLII